MLADEKRNPSIGGAREKRGRGEGERRKGGNFGTTWHFSARILKYSALEADFQGLMVACDKAED